MGFLLESDTGRKMFFAFHSSDVGDVMVSSNKRIVEKRKSRRFTLHGRKDHTRLRELYDLLSQYAGFSFWGMREAKHNGAMIPAFSFVEDRGDHAFNVAFIDRSQKKQAPLMLEDRTEIYREGNEGFFANGID